MDKTPTHDFSEGGERLLENMANYVSSLFFWLELNRNKSSRKIFQK